MTDLVDPTKIEKLLGVPRSPVNHIMRDIDGTIFIMHSHECVDSGIDLRNCVFSIMLDMWCEGPY